MDIEAGQQYPLEPDLSGYYSWNDYWARVHGQHWRTEPEISAERQASIAVWGAYGRHADGHRVRLTRADVEWLLANHRSAGMVGPVNAHDPAQRTRPGIDLRGADLRGADLSDLPLAHLIGGAILKKNRATPDDDVIAPWQYRVAEYLLASGFDVTTTTRDRAAVNLRGASLRGADLEEAYLYGADLRGADLRRVHLIGASLRGARLEQTDLRGAHLSGALLQRVTCDASTRFDGANLFDWEHGAPLLADIHWGGANLNVVSWDGLTVLGDERAAKAALDARRRAKPPKLPKGSKLPKLPKLLDEQRLEEETAIRANRQLAIELRNQGLSEVSDHLAYRALVLRRQTLSRQHQHGRVLWSWLLDLTSGYGYKPVRSVITYLVIVGCFALAYYFLGNAIHPPLGPIGALVFSVTSFHGRGFSPGENVSITSPITIVAAGEAIIGLLIEITFIATFTYRFFAR